MRVKNPRLKDLSLLEAAKKDLAAVQWKVINIKFSDLNHVVNNHGEKKGLFHPEHDSQHL
jgi:hypothetical protein